MKEIQGKIKFGVFEVYLPNDIRVENDICISKITEEQAAEFVESEDFLDYFKVYGSNDLWIASSKESLISLLKANDVWIKEWKESPINIDYLPDYGCQKYPQECFEQDVREYENLPDDLLLIKL